MTQATTPAATQAADKSATTGPADQDRRVVVGCQQLTKVFKDFWMRDRARAVDKLDLLIYEREVFGLLGPNGSGKSTTIKLILGLLKPTSGRVAVFGKSPTDVGIKKRIGYLPEESYLYPFLNARETLDYYGKLFGLDHRTRQGRIDELLNMVGLEHAQFRPVREYSKGMQRRIGIAQALINDPDLLILDEPTTGLDPIGTRQVKDLILELGRRGKTVILSSHLLTDVEDVVDRMAILYGGKMRGEGTCEKLLTSTERTLIETDELDEQTIAELDEVIRRRSGGEKSIRTVSAPRQKLEQLFLGIVEKAQNERAATSGAMQGGVTAAFLRAEAAQPREGEELIESLLGAQEEPEAELSPAASEPTRPADHTHEPPAEDESLIGSLMEEDDAPRPQTEQPSPSVDTGADNAKPDADVDRGIIGSLLDEDADQSPEPDDDEQGGKEPKR
ncbi:MAG: ATP-binding cassette domain-containing protein [Phycisphaerales bacterium]